MIEDSFSLNRVQILITNQDTWFFVSEGLDRQNEVLRR